MGILAKYFSKNTPVYIQREAFKEFREICVEFEEDFNDFFKGHGIESRLIFIESGLDGSRFGLTSDDKGFYAKGTLVIKSEASPQQFPLFSPLLNIEIKRDGGVTLSQPTETDLFGINPIAHFVEPKTLEPMSLPNTSKGETGAVSDLIEQYLVGWFSGFNETKFVKETEAQCFINPHL